MGSRRLEVEIRLPFRLDLTAWARRQRSHSTIGTWDGTTYRRMLVAGGQPFGVDLAGFYELAARYERLDRLDRLAAAYGPKVPCRLRPTGLPSP